MTSATRRLEELGITLPPAPVPAGSYVPVVRSGPLAVTAGMLPVISGTVERPGVVADEIDLDEARAATRTATLNALAALAEELGDLDAIHRIVRLEGYVASAPRFTGQADVLNAASDLLVQVFGDAGRHTRVAVGVSSLPKEAPVEIALWAEVNGG